MTFRRVTREFPSYYFDGKRMREEWLTYEYTIWYDEDGNFVEVRNKSGFTCEKNSDTYLFFSK